MAHVQMHQYRSDLLETAMQQYGRRKNLERELAQRERESRRSAGVSLQNTRSKLDTDLEIAKMNVRNQRDLAKFKAGIDLQLKQMGIDLDLELQKLRNMNASEIARFNATAAQILERMKNKNVQSQIVKQYQSNLKLANYNAKTALYRTFMDVMGDIYKTGDPISNAADTAAFGLWAMAFKMLYGNGTDIPEDLNVGNINEVTQLNESSEGGNTNEEIDKLIKMLKQGSEHVAPGSKITRHPKIGWKTKVKLAEKERQGKQSRPWEKR